MPLPVILCYKLSRGELLQIAYSFVVSITISGAK